MVDFSNIHYGLFTNWTPSQQWIYTASTNYVVHARQNNHATFIAQTNTTVLYSLLLLFYAKQRLYAVTFNFIQLLFTIILLLFIHAKQWPLLGEKRFAEFQEAKRKLGQLFEWIQSKYFLSLNVVNHFRFTIK